MFWTEWLLSHVSCEIFLRCNLISKLQDRENESPMLFWGVADPSQILSQVQVTLSYPWFPLKRGRFSIKNMKVRPLVGWNIFGYSNFCKLPHPCIPNS
jgi:hypothetical protein